MHKLTKINDYTFELFIEGEYAEQLYNCIQQILKSTHYEKDSNSLFFSAEHVDTLKKCLYNKRLSHMQTIRMIDHLSKQINWLKTKNVGIYGFDLDDVLVINGCTFILCSSQYITQLINGKLIFMTPFELPYFSNPEISSIKVLPQKVDCKCVYYSLGCLTVFSLLKEYLLVGRDFKTAKEIDIVLQPLKNTKMYWFLLRCLESNVQKRTLLLI